MQYMLSKNKIFKKTLAFSLFIILLIPFSELIKADIKELTLEEIGEIMENPISRKEMQTFVLIFQKAVDAVAYQNTLQYEINYLLTNDFYSDKISEQQMFESLEILQDRIYREQNKFQKEFNNIKLKSSSGIKVYMPLYKASYQLIQKLDDHMKQLAEISENQIKIIIEQDYYQYDQLSAKSYFLSADFVLLIAENLELNKLYLPDFNLSKIIIDIEIYGAKFLADTTRLQAFHLSTEKLNPDIVSKIHQGVTVKYEEYNQIKREIFINLKSFIETLNQLVALDDSISHFSPKISAIEYLAKSYINNTTDVIQLHLDIADLYLLYRDDLDSIPQNELDRINRKLEITQTESGEIMSDLNTALFEVTELAFGTVQ